MLIDINWNEYEYKEHHQELSLHDMQLSSVWILWEMLDFLALFLLHVKVAGDSFSASAGFIQLTDQYTSTLYQLMLQYWSRTKRAAKTKRKAI